VGVGSECNFTGEFSDRFPCDLWEGSSPSPDPITFAGSKLDGEGKYVYFAADRHLESVSGEIEAYQLDGSLGIVLLGWGAGRVEFAISSSDGKKSDCWYEPARDSSVNFKCGGFN
jgi:hypothetical protein